MQQTLKLVLNPKNKCTTQLGNIFIELSKGVPNPDNNCGGIDPDLVVHYTGTSKG